MSAMRYTGPVARTLGLALLLAGWSTQICAAELTITIENIRNDKGDVLISIYTSQTDWLEESTPDHDGKQKAQAGSVVFKFDLLPGVYGAAAFHDENSNGVFDTNFLGLPLEGYAMSNDARPFLSRPSFDAASFTLPPEGAAIVMHMGY
ncbi:MAG TPA: DUF2141 domain-containing protein [Stellaceae bacterium]|jgi:uncharacterized protein (DUF2141 family)|nr:DUF2141 domain-containing protein [Stellaceae bacterium]